MPSLNAGIDDLKLGETSSVRLSCINDNNISYISADTNSLE